MLHPDCAEKKQAHFLEYTLEWCIFDTIQPLFASAALQWSIADADLSSTPDAAIHTTTVGSSQDARVIESENAFEFFKEELEGLPDSAPDRAIDCGAFDDCRNYLAEVLDLLNGYVEESALEAARKLPTSRENSAPRSNGSDKQVMSDHESPPQAPAGLTTLGSRMLKQVGNFLKGSWLNTSVLRPINDPNPPKSTPTLPFKNCSKLEALGKLIEKALEDDPDHLQTACSIYLRLALDADEYINGLDILRKFNTCFESPQISGVSKLKEPSYPLNGPTTRWRDKAASKELDRLFSVICTRSSNTSCQGESTGRQHKAMLRLSGSQLDERPLAFSIFFLPCNSPESWQSVHLKPKDKHDFTRRQYVPSLCSYIGRHRSDPDASAILPSVVFDKDQLLENPSNLLGHSDTWPARSFRRLLQDGVIRDRFEVGDKAALALSLARCLLHIPLVHTPNDPWRDQAWTKDSVQFLHRNSTSEIIDVHHPYICYSICQKNHNQESGELQVDRYRVTLLSLARFLLEIHLGHGIDMEFSSSADLEDASNKLSNLLENAEGQKDVPKHYMRAIRGCLNFRASITSSRKLRSRDELSDLIRRAIYTSIIRHLEKNLSVVPKHWKFLVPRNVRLDALVHRSTYSNASPNNQPSYRRRSTIQLAQNPPLGPATTQSRSYSSISYPGDDLVMMFDGRVVNADHDHVSEAATFLSDISTFYTNHIKGRAEARRKAEKRRIRIAVLDTGINENDLYISPILHNIVAERRRQHLAQLRAARDEGKNLKRQGPATPVDYSPIRMRKNFVVAINTANGTANGTADGATNGAAHGAADGVANGTTEDTLDSCGHGTHTTGLLLTIAPDADIYVAKIACNIKFDDIDPVVKAIEWAIAEAQDVDIISMSFGIPGRNGTVAGAILTAARKIMFAAASNGGRNRPRTYPASDRNVICVHALSGKGSAGSVNPSTRNEHDRLGTLGMGLSLPWNGIPEYKDGTSYATPIAAGIAANWLEWLHAVAEAGSSSLTESELVNWTCPDGIEGIFSKVMSEEALGDSYLRYVAPWHLWTGNLSDDQIVGNIRRLVR